MFSQLALSLLFFASTIDGPDKVNVGELVVYKTPQEGKFLLFGDYPVQTLEVFTLDKQRALVFVPQKPGKFFVLFIFVNEGQADYVYKMLTVVAGDNPQPQPNPPSPPSERKIAYLLWVEESERRTLEEARIVREFITPNKLSVRFVVVDQDVVDENNRPPSWFVPYRDKARAIGLPVLFVVYEDNSHQAYKIRTYDEFVNLVRSLGVYKTPVSTPTSTTRPLPTTRYLCTPSGCYLLTP